MKFIRISLFAWIVLGTSLSVAQVGEFTEISFIPQWTPQAQFAGYYIALEKGFYRKFKLKVNILRGGPERAATEILETGLADFGTMFLSTGITKRANGVKLVNISQIVQRSAFMLVAKKSTGIHSPEGLQGKKVGLWGGDFRVQPKAFFRKYNLTVSFVPQSTTLNLFLRGGVDVASAMWYNEYHTILNAGMDQDALTTFMFSDHGMNFPEDGLYCMEDTLKREPELCCNFAKATIEGWKYAFAHPEEALDIVMTYIKKAKVATNRVHQRWMLNRMNDIISPPETGSVMGYLKADSYHQVAQELKRNGMIDRIPNFSELFFDCRTNVKE
jgi:NitT/TauT family transport system substrate-binding protein